ncbi:MAG: hypothetical protein IBJ00_06130 [Alphaproteobacteria bacterium]|nr:hypothetical protein [Alphaproteobacteria bacterium]
MCGIAGILNFDHRPVAHSQIKAMTDVIAHRGPDGEGQYIDGVLGLGHRRLAIIEISPACHQPMQQRADRFTFTFNIEDSNYKVLSI